MKEPPLILNLDDINEKRKLMQHVGTLKGLYEVLLKPRKRTRSLDQNAYYFAAVVQPFASWLRAEWGDPSITTEQAHMHLKIAVMGMETKVNKETGEVLELVPTTRFKDTAEFSNYVERAILFLAESCGIAVLDAEMFYERRL